MRDVTYLKRTSFSILVIALGAALIGIVSAQDTQKKELTAIIKSSSSVGDVAFPHQFHFENLEMECQTCHHETNASTLKMPHENYFYDFWIDCRICHRSDASAVSQPRACSVCHRDSPTDTADETLSAKVVIHNKCWECHELGKGEKASQNCKSCHRKDTNKSDHPSTSAVL